MPQNPFDLSVALRGLQQPQTQNFPPLSQLPPGEDNRRLGKDPMSDLAEMILGAIGVGPGSDPFGKHASQATTIGAGLTAGLPLLPGLNSRLMSAIEGISAKNVSPSKLFNAAQQVPEEAQFTGFLPWLKNKLAATGDNFNIPIPTVEAKQYIQDNPLALQEHVAGGGVTISTDQRDALRQPAFDQLRQLGNLGFDTPGHAMNAVTLHPDWQQRWDIQPGDPIADILAYRDMRLASQNNSTHYQQYTLPGGTDYQERNVRLNDPNIDYRSHPAFDPGNMLAWSRSDTRNTPNGPIKLIDEIQSDWHQIGNERGYRADEETLNKLRDMANSASARRQQFREGGNALEQRYLDDPNRNQDVTARDIFWSTRGEDTRNRLNPQLQNDIADWVEQHSAAFQAEEAAQKAYSIALDGVPQAPFKSQWPDLMLKRELFDTAQRDMTGLAIVPAAVQNSRWNLANHVDQLHWRPNGENGQGLLTGYKDGHNIVTKAIMPGELSDYVGQGVAKALMAAPNKMLDMGNIEVGGSGMKQFYDQSLPNKLQKIMNPFGGQVEQMGRIDTDPEVEGLTKVHEMTPNFGFNKNTGLDSLSIPLMGIKLTPAMKKLILERGFYALSPLLAATAGAQAGRDKQ